MMRFRSFCRILMTATAFLLLSVPVRSVNPDHDFQNILTHLLPELKQSYEEALESDSLLVDNGFRRLQLSEMVETANEVTIMLYTRRPEFAFDMAFALEKVTDVSDAFEEQSLMTGKYLRASRSGLRRYSLLGETLRKVNGSHQADSLQLSDSLLQNVPPAEPVQADSSKTGLLDSCLFYIDRLTEMYGKSVTLALQDSVSCAETQQRLQQAFEYAQGYYADMQKDIFIGGNYNAVQIVRDWKSFISGVRDDLAMRFGPSVSGTERTREDASGSERSILFYAGLSLLALILCFVVAGLLVNLVCVFVRRENVHARKPLISAILAILLFVVTILLINTDRGNPYWRMAYRLLSQFSWLTLAIFISLLFRVQGSQARPSRNLYIPTLLLAFLNILLRAVFLPASLVPLIFPPALLVFIIWQSSANIRYRAKVQRADLLYMWISVGVMLASCILSLCGYSMIGVFLFTFWTFQLALLHTITMLSWLMKRYYENNVTRRKARYHVENPYLPLEDKNAFIEVTWLHDLLRMVVVPVAILLSIPMSFQLTARAYQLSLAGADFLHQAPFTGEAFKYLNLFNILLIIALFFVFRYLIYLIKGLARLIKLRGIIEKNPDNMMPLKESDVNLSLSNSLFTLAGWLIYLIIVFSILHLPTSAITAVTTGLAAGVGFALRDLINNFFYGVQLMAGRIRVGDKISCDGIRGVVKRVSYQTTLVEEEDGSLIAFTNTDLFTKKFRNLNSGKNYEMLKMPVSVRYGTDIEKARQVILEALKPLMVQDKTGRDIVDPTFPIDVRFDSFGENSVNLIVALYSTVETHYTFPSRAKEAIYNAFHEHGIEIPFQQHDVYLKPVPDADKKPV